MATGTLLDILAADGATEVWITDLPATNPNGAITLSGALTASQTATWYYHSTTSSFMAPFYIPFTSSAGGNSTFWRLSGVLPGPTMSWIEVNNNLCAPNYSFSWSLEIWTTKRSEEQFAYGVQYYLAAQSRNQATRFGGIVWSVNTTEDLLSLYYDPPNSTFKNITGLPWINVKNVQYGWPQWQHHVLTYDGTQTTNGFKMYIDGLPCSMTLPSPSGTLTATWINSNNPVTVLGNYFLQSGPYGYSSAYMAYYPICFLAFAWYSGTCLTPEQVKTHWEAKVWRTGSLVVGDDSPVLSTANINQRGGSNPGVN